LFASRKKRSLQVGQEFVDRIESIAYPKPQIRSDLIVSGSSRMQLATYIAKRIDQSLLDMHMDVFELDSKGDFAPLDLILDFQKLVFDLTKLFVGKDTLFGKHPSMSDRASNVLFVEPMIKRDAFAESSEGLIHIARENTATG
jgi:hypothetical protein